MDYRDYRHNIYVCGVRKNGRIDHFMMPKGTVNPVALEPFSFAYDEQTGDILKSKTLKYHHTDRQIDFNYVIGLAEDMKDALEAMRDGKKFAVDGEF
jgi:hypothetical protein